MVYPVAGDASHRQYFRLSHCQQTRILLSSPPELENNSAFLTVRDLLEKNGLAVPACYAADLDQGFMLLEDFGDTLLLDILNEQSVDGLYSQAMRLLSILVQVDGTELPAYDREQLVEEMGRFQHWFVEGLLGLPISSRGAVVFSRLQQTLVSSALEQPQVLVHRDFHSRNLMQLHSGDLAMIDFQDAVVGGITYDLVSLLKDCYIRWPRSRVTGWALEFKSLLQSLGMLAEVTDEEYLRWFDWIGLQRHLKVLGTFARLSLRDNKHSYLDDLPLVIEYLLEALQGWAHREQACADFLEWFDEELQPLIETQPWMRRPA